MAGKPMSWQHLVKTSTGLVIALALGSLLTTCDMFQAGLGPKISVNPPSLTVTSPANGDYLRGTAKIQGTVSADVGVSSVYIAVTINSTLVSTISATPQNGNWSASLDTKALSAGVDGQANLVVSATDSSNKESSQKLVLYFDNTAPVFTSMSPSADDLSNTSYQYALSGKTVIAGSMKDALGMAKTVLTVGDLSYIDSTHPAAWSVVFDASQYYDSSKLYDSSSGFGALHGASYISTGLYSVPFSVVGTDLAGNTSTPVSGTLFVETSGAPLVSITAPVNAITIESDTDYPNANPSVKSSIVAPGSTVQLLVSDMDGLDVSQLYVALALGSANSNSTLAPSALKSCSIYKVGSGLTQSSVLNQTTLSNGATIPTRANYQFTVPTAIGEYMLLIHAADCAANKISGVSEERYLPIAPVAGQYTYSSLFVSNSNPTVTIASPSDGAYLHSLSATGTMTDDMGAADVNVTVTPTSSGATAAFSSGWLAVTSPKAPTSAWSYTYTGPSLADGSYSLSVLGKNSIGAVGATAATRTFTVDTTPPSVSVNAVSSPSTNNYVSGTIGIGGSASDSLSGIAKVEYQLDSGNWTQAVGTTSWSGNLDLSSVAEGSHSLNVRATDNAGNVSAIASTSLLVDKAPPSITESGVAGDANASVSYTTQTNASSLVFSGSVSDSNALASSNPVSVSIDGGASIAISLGSNGAWSYTYTIDVSGHSQDGSHSFVFTAKDVANKTASLTRTVKVDTTPPTIVVNTAIPAYTNASSFAISGTATDSGVGLASSGAVTWSITGGSNTPSAGDASGAAWGTSFSFSGEGKKQITLTAKDLLGNTATTVVTLYYDLYPPALSESDSVASVVNKAFSLSGMVYDTDPAGLPTLTVSSTRNGTTVANNMPISYSGTATASPGNAWSYPFTVDTSGHGNDGQWTFVITATDVAGRTTSVTKSVMIDTTPPTATISQPGNYSAGQSQFWLSGATASFSGLASDPGSNASGLSLVYYKVDSATKNHASDNPVASGWTQAAGTTNWSATINLSGSGGTGEGQFTFWVAAYDNAGNLSSISSQSFGVDQNPPTLTESSHPASSYTKAGFTLAGVVGDTNALASLSITESKNGAAAQIVSYTPSSVAGLQSVSYSSQSLPLGGVSDGTYSYLLTAIDAAGKTATVNRTVKIDTTPPTVTLNTIPAWISSSAYTISGNAADPGSGASGLASIQYQLDGNSLTGATWTDSSDGANTAGSWSATLSGLAEGSHTIVIKATDAAGNTTTLGSASFGVDLNPPNLSIFTLPATITAATAASFSGFSGSIYDTNPAGLPSLSVTSTQNGTNVASNVSIPYSGSSTSSPGNSWNYAFTVDASGHSTDGLWTFSFIATDVSGKTTTVSKTITIDTTPPMTTVTSPSAGSWVSSTSLSVTGVASDGSGTGVSKVYVKADNLYVASSSTDHSAEDPTVAANGWTVATGQTSWSATLSLSGEGSKTLWIKAVDAAGNVTTAAEAIASKESFGLDLNPPTLGFSDSVGTLVNAGFTLSGTTTDTNPVAAPTLAVAVDGGSSQPVSVSSGSWNFPVTVNIGSHVNDGSHTYVFTSTDVAGKTTTLSRTITVDTTPPTAAISQPASYTVGQSQYWLSGTTANLGGTAADRGAGASGVSAVYYKVDTITANHASDNPTSASWTLAAGTTNWSATINLSGTGGIGEGQFTLWVAAYDSAGNLSSISSQSFGVDQNPPTLSESSHPAISYAKETYTLAGIVGDTNALASLTISESKNGATAQTVSFTPTTVAGQQSVTYSSQNLPLGGVSDGTYTYVLTATDVAGKTATVNRTIKIDTTPPTVVLNAIPAWISSSAYTISGTAADPNSDASGLASIQYQLDGGSWAAATWVDGSGGANTSGNWSATLSGLAEGNHSIVIKATDAAGNTTTLSAASFGVDLNPPTLTETYINSASQVIKNSSFTMTGSFGDTNPLSVAGTTLTVTVSVNGGAATAATISGSTWSYTQPKVDGTYSYVITATDVSGKTSTLNRLVLLDSTAPVLGTSAPILGSWTASPTLSISGSSQDGSGSGTGHIYYLVDSASTDHSGDVAAWNATNGSAAPSSSTSAAWTAVTGTLGSWSGSVNLGSAEGYKRLWVVAADNAGNTNTLSETAASSFVIGTTYTISQVGTTDFTSIGASANTIGLSFVATGSGTGTGKAWSGTGIILPFGFDLSPPSLAETGIGTSTTLSRNSSLGFSGTVSDTDHLASTNFLTVSVDGGSATAIPLAGAPNWSYTYAVNAATHAQDGTHSFVFTATDIAGKTTTVTRTIQVDTVPPTLTVTLPTYGSWTSSATLSIGGSSQDGVGSGVSKVYYLIDAASSDHTADIAAWNATNGGAAPSSSTTATWTAASGLASSWTGTSSLTAEGSKLLWVVAADNAGNTTTLGKVAATALVSGSTYTIASIGTTDFTAFGASGNTVGLTFIATASDSASSGSGTAWSGNGAAIAFGYDVSPPSLSETAINSTSSVTRNASVSFSGLVSDSDALASANALAVSVDGGTSVPIPITSAPNWSYTYSVNAATHAQDGTHSFVFTATDIAGKTTSLARTVLVDTTPATVMIGSPTASSWTNVSPFTVTGTASDGAGAGVSQVWTLVDAAGNSHASDSTSTIIAGGAWQMATGTTSWTASWSLGTEGGKTLWVAVLDLAGNWTTSYYNLNFGYDATAPALVITPLSSYNAAFALAGTVSDAASGVASLKYKIDSGSYASVPVSSSWTSAISPAAFSSLGEGTHTVTVQATDIAGNLSTQTTTFLKDTTPPALTYTNISSSGGTVDQDSDPKLTGTLSDVSGVASATYTLQVWNYGTSSWNTIATSATLGSPANATSWTWSLDLSSTGLNLPDGKYQIAIGAADTPGNAIASPLQVPFFLSRSNPAVTVTAPGLGSFQNAAFPFVGTASDSNGITQVVAKLSSGSVSFGSGTTAAYPALPVTVAAGSPGVLTTASPHGLNVNDQVYLWASPMPTIASGSLQTGTVYYVQSVPTSTSFTISASSGGTAIAISASTATSALVGIVKDSFSSFHPSIPVTVNTSAGTLTAANHGLANGDIVYFQGTSLPAPTSLSTPCYIVNATASTFQVSTTSGGSALSLSSTGSSVSVWSSTKAVNWLVPAMSVSGFSDGALSAYVQVGSGSGKSNQSSQSFTQDTTPPSISIASPSSSTRQVGNLTIVGTTSDPGTLPSGVTGSIQYQIGNTYNLGNAASWTSANVTGGSYSWSISLGDMSAYANSTFATQCDATGKAASGTNLWKLPIVFQAVDKAGNAGQLTTYYLILDPNGNIPVVTITDPATGLTFGGLERVSGTATQPTWINSVEVAIDPAGGSNFPASPVSVSLSGSTLSATSQPFTAGQMVFLSGSTAPQIGGTAVSSTTAYWVVNPGTNSFQVAASSGGSALSFSSAGSGVTASCWAPATLKTTGNSVTWYYDVNSTTAYPQNGATSQKISLQARAWNSATAGGSKGTLSGTLTSPFIMTFNSSFPQIQNITVNGASYYAQMITSGTISLSATVSSSKGISKIEGVESSPLSGSTTMYSTANSYGATTVSNSVSSSYWQSTVTPPTTMTNDSFASGNTKQIMITAAGSNAALWTAAGAPATTVGTVFVPNNVSLNVASSGGSFIESDSSGNFNYAVSMTLNSAALYSATTGQYAFTFRMTDMTSPTSQVATSSVILDEDNYYPTTTLSNPTAVTAGSLQTGTRYMILSLGSSDFTTVGAASNAAGVNFVATGAGSGTGTVIPVLTGTSVKIQGSATDTGTGAGSIQDLSKVIVYLTNSSGSLLNLSSGGTTQSPSTLTAMNGANYGPGNTASYSYPATSTYSGYFASIDTLGMNGTTNPHDGFVESLMLDGSSDDWWVQLDTTKQSDGPVTVHVVVWDSAGNATHYAQSAYISNNAPALSSIVLGTDLTGAGTVNATQSVTSNFSATNFTARNKLLSFAINSVYGGGNGSLSYSLIYGGHDYLNPSGQAGVTISGSSTGSETVTLNFASLSPSIADTSASNGASFTIKVSDQTTGSNQSYSQTIALSIHNTDSTAPTINLAPFGQVYSAPVDSANGGVNTDTGKTLGSVSAYSANIGSSGGHVEYTSPVTSGASAVSGQVVFKGKAWDDEYIQKITATIPGFNSGAEFTIASYSSSSGGLVGSSGTGWIFALDTGSQSLSLADGNVCNWSFTWDSSQISTVTAKNVTVTFKAYNSSSMTSSASMVIDIVPYITKITSALSSGYSSVPSVLNRSANGAYPVRESETLTIDGYNFNGSSTTATANGTALTVTAVSGKTTTEIQANVGTTATSGALTLTVNSINSINNLNSTVNAWNQEANGVNNNTLSDHRVLDIWRITSVLADSTIRYPSMSIASSTTAASQYMGWAFDQSENYFYMTPQQSSTPQKFEGNPTRYYDTTFAFDDKGDSYGEGNSGDITAGGTSISNWSSISFFYLAAGSEATQLDGGYNSGTYKSRIMSLSSDGSAANTNSNRVQNPDMVAALATAGSALSTTNAATVYLSYYDAVLNQVMLRTGTVTTGSNSASGALLEKGTSNAAPWDTAGAILIASSSTTAKCGPYSAIALDPVSRTTLVAVWYDNTNQTLWYSYNTAPTTNTAQWQSHAIAIDTNFAGWYCDVTVDGSGAVHMAYNRSSSGDLCYAYLPSITSTSPTVVTVDSYLSVGQYLKIGTLKNSSSQYVPYISYYASSYASTSESVKIAYRSNMTSLQNGASNDLFTNAWECMTLPLANVPKAYKVSLGFKDFTGSGTSLVPVLGYATNAGLEYSYMK